ncbi:MAG: GUN4 domain-containing protein [Nostoc sp.]|uniref:GUN4 domain-containing protein n=1 Tax=Nostoc sp. TaxID=1180 RepID=UPI002FF74BBF
MSNARSEIQESQSNLSQADKKVLDSSQGLQIQVLFQKSQGNLLVQEEQIKKAIKSYTIAFHILTIYPYKTDFTKENQLLTDENIQSVYRGLINLIFQNITELKFRREVETSFTKYLYAQLEYFLKAKNWKSADIKTSELVFNITKKDEQGYMDYHNINSFSCPDLQKIDHLWVNADNRFGFGVQKEIWIKTGNRLGIKPEDWNNFYYKNYIQFAKAVGWYDEKRPKDNQTDTSRGSYVSHDELYNRIKYKSVPRGSLPILFFSIAANDLNYDLRSLIFSHCDLQSVKHKDFRNL